MEILNDAEWRLKSINIRYEEWGEYKGKYLGKIEFANKQNEAFSFNINQDKAHEFLALIRDSVTESASRLGERLMQSLPKELVAPKAAALVEDIPHTEK